MDSIHTDSTVAPSAGTAPADLSKSDLLAWRRCPRLLWLQTHRPELGPPSADAQRRARDGLQVGELARRLLPTPPLWPNAPSADASHAQSAAHALELLLQQRPAAAVEVPLYAHGLYCRADALLREDAPSTTAARWVLQETKASLHPGTTEAGAPKRPEPHHLDDAAIQTWVMQQCGLPPARVELNYINPDFEYPGHEIYDGFFRVLDVSHDAVALAEQVPQWLALASETVRQPQPPHAEIGAQCRSPHPCSFQSHCAAAQAEASASDSAPLTLLPGTWGKRAAAALAQQGYRDLRVVPPEKLGSATSSSGILHRRIQRAHRSGEAVAEPALAQATRQIPYPRFYFDFEGIDMVIPRWRGLRPMEQVPFQWSCHVQASPEAPMEHHAFLDLSGDDPTEACLQAMDELLGERLRQGSLLVYYAAYERGRMLDMARRQPHWRTRIEQWVERIVDLHPLVRDHYYHPVMRGSFSIKAVIKALAPELDYGTLDQVHNGTDAQLAYLQAAIERALAPADLERLRRNLLLYCERDTWSMVRVLQALESL